MKREVLSPFLQEVLTALELMAIIPLVVVSLCPVGASKLFLSKSLTVKFGFAGPPGLKLLDSTIVA